MTRFIEIVSLTCWTILLFHRVERPRQLIYGTPEVKSGARQFIGGLKEQNAATLTPIAKRNEREIFRAHGIRDEAFREIYLFSLRLFNNITL